MNPYVNLNISLSDSFWYFKQREGEMYMHYFHK
jgi:hypothetical protein